MIPLDDLKGLAARGWALFPCYEIRAGQCSCSKGADCDSPGKHPRVSNGVNAATSDDFQITRWSEMYPHANWAVATGAISGVWVLDVDNKPDRRGTDSLNTWLQQMHFKLGETYLVATGGGGWHLYFRATDHLGNRTNVLSGVDVRGDGGYVLIAGSNHISGVPYTLSRETDPISADHRLIDLVQRQMPKPVATPPGASVLDPVAEGERNDTLFRRACSLRRKTGDDRKLVDMAIRTAGRESGLSDREIDTIMDSAFQQDHSDDLPAIFASAEPSRLNLRGASEVRNLPKPKYLIEGVMPMGGLFQVFGPTGEYKSFVMLDMLACIANGLPWMGHEVTAAGPVAFVLGEGGYDAGVRVEAWMLAHPEASDERIVYSIEEQIDLLNDSAVEAIMEDLEEYRLTHFAAEPWRMIVFDTQADHMPSGDEDKAGDITRLKASIQRIAHATGAAVGLVHHTGHEKSRERGSSRQRQAMDVVMQVQSNRIVNEKQKGAAKFEPIPFTVDPFGDSIVVRGLNTMSAAAEGFQAEVESGRAVVAYLAANPHASQRTLKNELKIGDGTFQGLRDLLEGIGYIEVIRDSGGTARSLKPTPQGLAWYGVDPDVEPETA
jgi:hypothetical protein